MCRSSVRLSRSRLEGDPLDSSRKVSRPDPSLSPRLKAYTRANDAVTHCREHRNTKLLRVMKSSRRPCLTKVHYHQPRTLRCTPGTAANSCLHEILHYASFKRMFDSRFPSSLRKTDKKKKMKKYFRLLLRKIKKPMTFTDDGIFLRDRWSYPTQDIDENYVNRNSWKHLHDIFEQRGLKNNADLFVSALNV